LSEGNTLGRAWGVGSAAAVVAAAVAVSFGTGFSASRAVLGDGGAWLSKGRTIAHVNAATGTPDAEVDADLVDEPGDQQIVRWSEGVAVVDTAGDEAAPVDTATMTPEAEVGLPDGAGRPGLVVAGDHGYMVGADTVQPVDPATLQPTGDAVRFGRIGGAVATAEETLAVLDTEDGTVVEIDGGVAQLPVEVTAGGDADGGADRLALSAVSGRPYVVDSDAGTVRRLRPGGAAEEPIPVDGLAGLAVDDLAVADPAADGSVAWLVSRRDGSLFGVDLDAGRVASGNLGMRGGNLQTPVVHRGQVYVPNGDTHAVTVVDGEDLHEVATHEVEGRSARLEVFADDGRVWINDPAARTALAVEPDGSTVAIDKGTGHGVEEPRRDRSSPDRAADARRPPTAPPAAEVPAGSPAPAVNAPPAASPEAPARAEAPPPAEAPATSPPTAPAPPPPPRDPPAPPARPAPPPQADVPRVIGLRHREACGRVEVVRLACVARPVRTAPAGTAEGEVVAQNPAGGRLPIGGTVTVDYYEPDKVPVPNVAGLRVVGTAGDPQAGPTCLAIEEAGFACAPAGSAPAAVGQPADVALSQQPAAGAPAVPGATVAVTYAPQAVVPPLSGHIDTACAALESLNLACGRVVGGPSATPGQVTAQSQPGGTPLPAGSPVNVTYGRSPVVPQLVGLDESGVYAACAAELLSCSWQVNPTNSVNNPSRADLQSATVGTAVPAGTPVVSYHPAGPDMVLDRYRALRRGRPINQWALGPTGHAVHAELEGRPNDWQRDGGTAGRCYSTQVAGSIPLYDFMRRSRDDPNHEDHFYAAGQGSAQFNRGAQYYGSHYVMCYVVPWESPSGGGEVIEWWEGTSDGHFYAANGQGPPAGGWTPIAQWRTW
jgi:beta-lactam-binding protein with PASTA domain